MAKNRESILSRIGSVGEQRGKTNENKLKEAVLKAITDGRVPGWLTGYEALTVKEQRDLRKPIDGWAVTDVGKIGVQIKSSLKGMELAKSEFSPKVIQNIAFVLVEASLTDDVIISEFIREVGALRDKYSEARSKQVYY